MTRGGDSMLELISNRNLKKLASPYYISTTLGHRATNDSRSSATVTDAAALLTCLASVWVQAQVCSLIAQRDLDLSGIRDFITLSQLCD